MRALRLAVWAVAMAAGCDPEPGSLIDCEPAPVPSGEIGDDVAPAEPAAMQAWLASGGYAGYLAESAPHRSSGAHSTVRTFVNRRLAESLAECASPHPVGATSVKELYDGEELRGWAVMVKTGDPLGASHWYWYEVFDLGPDAAPAVAGQGHGTCRGCHDGGLDAFRSPWPLQ
jgi:hypothetical protein